MKLLYPILKFSVVTLVAFGFYCPANLQAQQEAQYSQYMVNYFTLNPGVAGTGENTEIKVGLRSQWAGFEGAPKTGYFTIQGALNRVNSSDITKHKSKKYVKQFNPHGYHSLGGYIYHDATGPISRSALYGAYAYNIALANSLRASLGAYVGLKQFRVDGSRLQFFDPNDPLQAGQSEIVPDASLGLWMYSNKFYLGASIHQVMGNSLDVFNNAKGGDALQRHYFFTAGVNVRLSNEWYWVPSVLVRMVNPVPTSFDINSKIKFKDLLWGAASYRKDDAVILMAGFTLNGNIDVSYSYDITNSAIQSYSRGTHEIVVGLRLKNRPKTHNPSDFW
jgi:type IX secretion system PorP/SprF family membrane protein